MRSSAFVLAALLTLVPLRAFAQGDVAAASAAFAEAQKAQLRGEYSRAAELFELADQASPSPEALRSAIRNREAAGHEVGAATLALRALDRYPDDKETSELAQGTLTRLSPKLTKVRAQCSEPCQLTVDGSLVSRKPASSLEFFVASGEHTIEARWSNRPSVSQRIDGAAGASQELAFEAPPVKEEPPEPAPATPPAPATAQPAEPVAAPQPSPPSEPARGGLPPAVFWVGTGLTVVAGGLLTWSGLDTLAARDRFETNPTQKGYDDGVDLERRTNILAGATAVLGVTTIALGLFATDWGGGEAGAFVSDSGVAFTYRGSLP